MHGPALSGRRRTPRFRRLMFALPEADRLTVAAAAALARGDVAQAASLLDQAIRTDPRHPMALTKQAELALVLKDAERALGCTTAALAIEPNFAPAWYQRSSACWSAGRQAEAVAAARQAVDIQPPNPDFRLRFAQFAAWTGCGAEARDAILPLLASDRVAPVHHAAALSMLGEVAIAEGRFSEANTYLDQALELVPTLGVARMLRGMNRLRLGQFRTGWVDYAAREAIAELYPDGAPLLAEQVWQGQTLQGKTMVVFDDQGNGDAIQFFRYLPMLRHRGAAHLTWRTFPPLVRLLRGSAPYATVTNTLRTDARFDFQCSSTSLPRWFGTEPDSIPAAVPYVRVGSDLRPRRSRKARVGLAWSGDARHTRDHLRSIPAEWFLCLADLPGIAFESLQHEVRPADRPALDARPWVGRTVEAAVDLADTAALIARLDLVITVDTAIAHLAGALGKPVWILLHVAPDWRWMSARPDSPWYPTARLFRVAPAEWRPGGAVAEDVGWAAPLGRVSAALRAFAAG